METKDVTVTHHGRYSIYSWFEGGPDPNRAYCDTCGKCRNFAVNDVCLCGRAYADMESWQVHVEWLWH
jgi:hypothetical protein